MESSSSHPIDIISIQMMIAELKGVEFVVLRGLDVLDEQGTVVFSIPADFPNASARVKTIASCLGIDERIAHARAAKLLDEGELRLPKRYGIQDQSVEFQGKSTVPQDVLVNAWKAKLIALATVDGEKRRSTSAIPTFAKLLERIGNDLLPGGRLAGVEPILGLQQRDIREMWVDVEVTELISRNSAFASSSDVAKTSATSPDGVSSRSRFTLLMDGFRGSAAIFGEPGAGKSTLLKWFANDVLLGRFSAHNLPVYISLRRYAERIRTSQMSLQKFAFESHGIRGVSEQMAVDVFGGEVTSEPFSENRLGVVFLLDGWDEVPSEMRETVLEEIQHTIASFTSLITSRPSEIHSLPISKLIRVEPLSPISMHDLIHNWLDRLNARVVIDHLTKHPRLEMFARNPFILTALCGIVESRRAESRESELPRNLPELYGGILQSIRRQCKEIRFVEFNSQAVSICERLAFQLFIDNANASKFDFSKDDFDKIGSEGALLVNVIAPSRIAVRSDPDSETYSFLHPTLHEYLASRFLKQDDCSESLKEVLRYRIHSPRWAEVLKFLSGQIGSADAKTRAFFLESLKELLQCPDRFGIVVVRVSDLIGEFHVSDGGMSLVGIDLRPRLWEIIEKWPGFHNAAEALARLDYSYIEERCKECIDGFQAFANEAESRQSKGKVEQRRRAEIIKACRIAMRHWGTTTQAPSYLSNRARNDQSGPPITRVFEVDRLLSQDVAASESLDDDRIGSSIRHLGRLARCGSLSAIAILISEYWTSPQSSIRALIVSQLGLVKCREARDGLVAIMAVQFGLSNEGLVALDNLSDFPCGSGEHFLLELLVDESAAEGNRSQAAFALGTATDSKVIDKLCELTFSSLVPLDVRMACLGSLGANGEPRHIGQICKMIMEGDVSLKETLALDALFRLVLRLESRVLFPEIYRELEAIAEFTLGSSDPHRQAFGIKYAGILGGQFLDRLFDLTCRPDFHKDLYPDIEEAAVRIGTPEAMDALMRHAMEGGEYNHDSRRLGRDAVFAILQHQPSLLGTLDRTEYADSIANWSQKTSTLVFDGALVLPSEPNDPLTSDINGENEDADAMANHELVKMTNAELLALDSAAAESVLRAGVGAIRRNAPVLRLDFNWRRFDSQKKVGRLAEIFTLKHFLHFIEDYKRLLQTEVSCMDRQYFETKTRLFGFNAIQRMLGDRLGKMPGKGTVQNCQIFSAFKRHLNPPDVKDVDRSEDSAPATIDVVVSRESENALRDRIANFGKENSNHTMYCEELIQWLNAGGTEKEVGETFEQFVVDIKQQQVE